MRDNPKNIRPLVKVDQDYQIHLCKSRVHLWLKILASALWQEVY